MEKKVLIIIAARDFRDEEYQEPKTILEKAGVKVVVASTAAGTARGMFGMQVTPDTTVNEVNPAEFDAVVVVGGSGSQTYLWNNMHVHKIVQALHQRGCLVAAICISPVILAKVGLLNGKKATVFRTATTLNELEKGGALISNDPVVVDGKIITGRGPEAAKEFGRKIADNLLI
ncbi:MAG: DJ-1/PfpI family protein [Candidatus Bathyarchaeota archaeon]|nr:MAG: DJ-1/PfpI family protein [Candidatus Bathyarchaeota archaeon]